MAITQKNRKIQVMTSLGEDALLFYKMYGAESLSEPFEYSLELLSENRNILPEDLLGNCITVGLELEDGSRRYFNGYVTHFGQTADRNELACYRVTVRPWLWFLTRSADCRIFQQQSVPEIIKHVFTEQGFGDFKDKLNGSYAAREYCVQYRETDFNFVSRLMEEEGIYYYFSHENGKHFLVLSDVVNSHEKFPGYGEIRFHPERGSTDRSRTDHIHAWEFAREIQPGNYEITDYDFKKPRANLRVKSKIKQAHTRAEHEFFDYPGRYTETAVGDKLVQHRIEAHHARFDRSHGQCNARGLAVGYLFNLTEYPRADQNLQYLVTSAQYSLSQDDYSSSGGGEGEFFDCSFSALDSKRPFRPMRKTEKPLVHGSQTAFVVGPKGEEIYTDQYGRVKVQFHWDRYGKVDENSSCWIRVSHPWAGKNWGMVALPRIGHEVVVEFLEGDPDQPLIVGSVYNADTMPPYALPGNKTQSGIKSRSSKGGTPDNFNEFRFEDKSGEEQIYLHAEKNYDIVVENNETRSVGADRSKTVTGNETAHVKKQRNHSVDKAEIISVGENQNISVGTTYTLEVKDQITLKCGASTITMNSGGEITINGVLVTVIGSSKIDLNP